MFHLHNYLNSHGKKDNQNYETAQKVDSATFSHLAICFCYISFSSNKYHLVGWNFWQKIDLYFSVSI